MPPAAVPSFVQPVPSAHVRAKVVIVFLVVCALSDCAGVLSDIGQYQLLAEMAQADVLTPTLASRAEANDIRQALVGLVQMIAYFATIIPFLMWWHRAYKSLSVISETPTKYTPGWAVGYWFIPIWNLVRPYQIGKELWERSTPARDASHDYSPSAGIVGLWWLLWIATNVVGNILLRASFAAETSEELTQQTAMQLVLDAGSIALDLCAILVVRGIDSRQEFKRAMLTDGNREQTTETGPSI